jgi:hypothetical protein
MVRDQERNIRGTFGKDSENLWAGFREDWANIQGYLLGF